MLAVSVDGLTSTVGCAAAGTGVGASISGVATTTLLGASFELGVPVCLTGSGAAEHDHVLPSLRC